VDPATIVVEPPMLTLVAGHDAWLAAQANDTAGQPIGGSDFRFSSSDPRVLSVTPTGHVIALGPASAQATVNVASGRKVQRVPVQVLPGALARLETLSGNNQLLYAGVASTVPLTVRALDQWGNPIAEVALRIIPGADAFPEADGLAGMDGTARFTLPALTQPGDVAVLIRSVPDPIVTATFHLRVQPGPVAAIEEIPTKSPLGPTRYSLPVDVRVTDAYGNPVAGVALQARVAGHADLTLSARTDAAGSASFLLPRERFARQVELTVSAIDAPTVKQVIAVKCARTARDSPSGRREKAIREARSR
jgi:hypothetical protein